MFAKSAILFLYMACVVVLGAAFTCCMLVGSRNKSEQNKAMLVFIIGLFVICFYDMGIYYCNYVIGIFSSMEVMRIGNCLIALTIYAWIVVQEKVMKKDSLKLLGRMVKNYILFYAGLWLILTIATSVEYFYTMKWLLLLTDIVLIVGALAVSIAYIIYAAVDNQKHSLCFMTITTALLLWNYISYFWGETSVYWGNSDFIREPLDLTIVFWLAIAVTTLLYAYHTGFKPTFHEKTSVAEELVLASGKLEDRIGKVCEEFGLTRRECELLELIYQGKSNKDIAERLFLSESTVKTHIYNIFRKMNVKSRVEAICVVNGEKIDDGENADNQ
ncbi:MAG: helix-turn-helix transcriptional regulator [Bacillota bacterium]|nr:helix-turn-helix transcriptional regulator [Bacillota bacterium]